jgi:hypothetical protein
MAGVQADGCGRAASRGVVEAGGRRRWEVRRPGRGRGRPLCTCPERREGRADLGTSQRVQARCRGGNSRREGVLEELAVER